MVGGSVPTTTRLDLAPERGGSSPGRYGGGEVAVAGAAEREDVRKMDPEPIELVGVTSPGKPPTGAVTPIGTTWTSPRGSRCRTISSRLCSESVMMADDRRGCRWHVDPPGRPLGRAEVDRGGQPRDVVHRRDRRSWEAQRHGVGSAVEQAVRAAEPPADSELEPSQPRAAVGRAPARSGRPGRVRSPGIDQRGNGDRSASRGSSSPGSAARRTVRTGPRRRRRQPRAPTRPGYGSAFGGGVLPRSEDRL